MITSVVYQGNSLLGEVDIYPQNPIIDMSNKEIRISHFSPPSERCPPLAVLHTIASCAVCFKMESKLQSEESPLFSLHSACLRENKTAVVLLGEEELHLVAMSSRKNLETYSCFWGFNVMPGLYNSCLVMLNLRCLGIVFDLDETLIVANTLRSFEDRIDALQRKISSETDPQRISGMLSEVKRYQDDKNILKQYAENDQVIDNGKVIKIQSEIVPPLSDNHQPIVRPLIRLHERNIILTRINPVIRDTSVLVRRRPAWEDLRSYLTAKGRKRFEVYVCTMAERDYALEMWRLLDPDSNLINPKKLLDRIVCVKSGSKKSLLNVFQNGICHPKMALVIDDRLKVWEEKDQPRVHVVPAFAPYYAPQAKANNAVPVLCVARNVACNVRGIFFKEFDEGLLQQISDVLYEDNMSDFPSAPDVSNYLISEGDASISNGNRDPLAFDGMVDTEVERRLKEANCQSLPVYSATNLDVRPKTPALQPVVAPTGGAATLGTQIFNPLHTKHFLNPIGSVKQVVPDPDPSMQGSPVREEGEVPESELDPDTRRRLLILQHGQDMREQPQSDPPPPPPPPPFSVRPPPQVPVPPVHSRGGYYPTLEEDMSPRKLTRGPKEFQLEPEPFHFDKHRPHPPPFFRGFENSAFSERVHENQRLPKQVHGDDQYLALSNYRSFPGDEMPLGRTSSSSRDLYREPGRAAAVYPETPAGALKEIAIKCGSKQVEFRPALAATTKLKFLIEVWFIGEKIGEGTGKTRKEAQQKAAESSLKNLANTYLSQISPDPGDFDKLSHANENGFLGDSSSLRHPGFSKDEASPIPSTSEQSRFLNQRLERSNTSVSSVSALKELCMVEGLSLEFQQTSLSKGSSHDEEVYAEVEVAGQVLGKGTGSTWDEAKLQAAEEAFRSLNLMLGQFSQKRLGSPRSLQTNPNKRLKSELPLILQRLPSSIRYSKNGPPVP
ncbi:RNA polymerase II C-terminal domain phosphatase-like 1 isoform X2 [Aristolochia californica]|uniref:RNA polymerase II C-terminal domain phosphatase-like 1 isoform X2 n=1 Tax=Aristolochia californica TaxID=171875 RepID=UPI0035DC3F17